MSASGHIKPTDKTIKAYYATLQAYADQQVIHEGAVDTAFQHLLTDTARAHGWMLVTKLPVKRGGKPNCNPSLIDCQVRETALMIFTAS